MCLENGSYLWNFAACKECGKKDPIVIAHRTEHEDEEEEEFVTYKRELLCCINLFDLLVLDIVVYLFVYPNPESNHNVCDKEIPHLKEIYEINVCDLRLVFR